MSGLDVDGTQQEPCAELACDTSGLSEFYRGHASRVHVPAAPLHSGVTNIYQPAALTSILWRTWTVALPSANRSESNGPFFNLHASPLADKFP